MIDPAIIEARHAFRLEGYLTLKDVDMDGDFVSPLQIAARSPTGPVLLAYNWLDAMSVRNNYATVRRLGYLPDIPFNKVVDAALDHCGLSRADVYMTQVFHLLPPEGRSSYVPTALLDCSFQAITCYELQGRKVIALGGAAEGACRRYNIQPFRVVDHPSARGEGRTIRAKAAALASAIMAVLQPE